MKIILFVTSLFVLLGLIYCQGYDQEEEKERAAKLKAGIALAEDTLIAAFAMHEKCFQTAMPRQKFLIDNLQSFILQPARTTLGFDEKFSANRKFFGNLLQSTEFKDMLVKDEKKIRADMVKKLRFCEKSVLDPEVVKDFYDREVDQSKL